MDTVTMIRSHAEKLPPGTIITTRDILHYGTRRAIDQAIYRLVHDHVFIRLARGVFVLHFKGLRLPDVFQVAKAKAIAFGRRVISDESAARQRAGAIHVDTDGCPSSFVYLPDSVRVCFRRIGSRKVALGQGAGANAVRMLWKAGRTLGRTKFSATIDLLSSSDRKLLRANMRFMPDWLNRFFDWYGRPPIRATG